MSTAQLKLQLVQKLPDTNNKNIINHIKAIFSTREENWFNDLPKEIQKSVERGSKAAKEGRTEPHEKVMKRFRK
jgi:hypothetical protein